MREIESCVFSSLRSEVCVAGACYFPIVALSKYLKSFGFKEYFSRAKGSVNKQDFFYEPRGLPFVNKTTTSKILLRENMRTAEETAFRIAFFVA